MRTTDIRQKLHQIIDDLEDKKLKAVYTILESEVAEDVAEYSQEFKDELDRRYEEYKTGKEKSISHEEVKKRVQETLSKYR